MFGLTTGPMFAIGTAVTTVVAAATGALVYRAWQAPQPPPIATVVASAPAAPVVTPAPVLANPAPARDAPASKAAGIGQPNAEAAAKPSPVEAAKSLSVEAAKSLPVEATKPSAGQPAPPAFDVVRVEPTGDAVVAGRATPNSDVALLDRGTVIAEMKADSNGQFAFVPPRLPAGDHLLALGEKSGSGQVVSAQTVTVAVPKKKNPEGVPEGVVVALTEPDRPTRILSDAVAPAPRGGQPQRSSDTPSVAIRTVETEDHGGFFATGSAAPGAEIKLYLNGSAVADVHAGQDGHWSLQIAKGMQPGSYAVRADEIDASSGKVVARAEVPFDYKAVVAAGNGSVQTVAKTGETAKNESVPKASVAATDELPAGLQGAATEASPMAASPNDAVIAALSTLTVVRGDSLWRISRKVLGRGVRYTQIYAANVSQIRDPDLIYPGQVLVKPQSDVN